MRWGEAWVEQLVRGRRGIEDAVHSCEEMMMYLYNECYCEDIICVKEDER